MGRACQAAVGRHPQRFALDAAQSLLQQGTRLFAGKQRKTALEQIGHKAPLPVVIDFRRLLQKMDTDVSDVSRCINN
jgi:hypothetical protein